jgi:hypothetical protein
MSEIGFLARRFWVQLLVRSVFTALGAAAIVGIFIVLTSPLDEWWFTSFPALGAAGAFIQGHNPWDFFIFAFIVTTALGYVRQVVDALADRYNLAALVEISSRDLDESETPMRDLGAVRATLAARRRLLESLLAFAPAAAQVLVVGIILMLNRLALAGLISFVVLVGVCVAVPWMTGRFTRRRMAMLERLGATSRERIKDKTLRARRAFNLSAGRLQILVNRPIERLRVGWPVLLFASLGGCAIAISIISDMTAAGELPQRSTLLIVFLILAARAALSSAQRSEDLAFFATAVEQINESEDGGESL